MRVLVTRPRQEAHAWVDQLQQAGLEALALPLIEVMPAADPQAVLQAWQRIAGFNALMFVSGNAVDYFFALRPDGVEVFNDRAAVTPRAFVTGPGSYAALTERAGAQAAYIFAPDAAAGQFDSEALWAVVAPQICHGFKVLIVRGTGAALPDAATAGVGRDWFARQVLQAGGEVEFVVAYQRKCPDFLAAQRALVQAASTDGTVWLFSSSEAIDNLVHAYPLQNWQNAHAVATHARIGQAASKAGFGRVLVARPVLADILTCIQSLP